MVMDTIMFEMPSLVLTQVSAEPGELMDFIVETELTFFEEGYYKNGPTIVELKPTQFDTQKTQDYKIYMPTNEPVTAEGCTWVEQLRVDKALRRRVPFDEGLEMVIRQMKQYAQGQGLDYEDRVLLVMTLVYGQYWVDFLVPYQDKK